MSGAIGRHIGRHRHFYVAGVLALAAFFLARASQLPLAGALAGDIFYLAYLALALRKAFHTAPATLRQAAASEDEGIVLIILITGAAICFSLVSLFALLNGEGEPATLLLPLAVASAPLGWLMLHTIAAFHYAHRFYARGSHGKAAAPSPGLEFPGTAEPGAWDFLYFAFVIGMTAQVSDVQVTSTPMRQFVWLHGVVSFFFNTVLIALAVNIAVALASGGEVGFVGERNEPF